MRLTTRSRVIALLMVLSFVASRGLAAQPAGVEQAIRLFDDRRYAPAEAALLALERRGDADARVAYYLGRIALERGRSGDAVKRLEAVVKGDERNASYRTWLARALMDQAKTASVVRRPSLARRVRSELERAVALDPRSVEARRGLMEVFLRAPAAFGGSRDKAAQQAREIATIDPVAGRLARAELHRHDRDAAAAERELRAAIADPTAGDDAFTALGRLLEDERRHDDAAAVYERLARERPRARWALFEAGRLALRGGQRLDAAERALTGYLNGLPPGTEPSEARTQLLLGELYERTGRRERARLAYAEAARLEPANREARAALERLRE